MAKKSNWFDALKKVFSPDSEEKKQRKVTEKPKKKWHFGRSKSNDKLASSSIEEIHLESQTQIQNQNQNHQTNIPSTSHPNPSTIPARLEQIKEVKLSEIEDDQNKHAYSVALASAVAAEAAAVAAQAAAEVVRLTAVGSGGNLRATQMTTQRAKEGIAAVKIQTAVRGFLARRSLRALRGLARLKTLVDGNTVQRQTEKTLHFIQSQTRIQSAIRSRRRQMVEEKQAVQKLDKLKLKEQDKSKIGEDWDFSLQTKEQIDSSIQTRQEAAIRRERALAYAFSHQWRNSTSSSNRVSNPFITDPTNPQWGWSWLDRWIAARPWEPQNPKPSPSQSHTNHSSLKSALQSLKPNPNSHSHSAPAKTSRPASPSTPRSKISSIKPPKVRSSSPKPSVRVSKEEDSRSIGSVKSERMRRHSVAGSIGDNVSLTSLTSLPVVPSYLQSTESSRLKSRMVYSPISEKIDERGGTKKRLSFASGEKLMGLGLRSASPVKGRRFSGPARVELVSLKDDE